MSTEPCAIGTELSAMGIVLPAIGEWSSFSVNVSSLNYIEREILTWFACNMISSIIIAKGLCNRMIIIFLPRWLSHDEMTCASQWYVQARSHAIILEYISPSWLSHSTRSFRLKPAWGKSTWKWLPQGWTFLLCCYALQLRCQLCKLSNLFALY